MYTYMHTNTHTQTYIYIYTSAHTIETNRWKDGEYQQRVIVILKIKKYLIKIKVYTNVFMYL